MRGSLQQSLVKSREAAVTGRDVHSSESGRRLCAKPQRRRARGDLPGVPALDAACVLESPLLRSATSDARAFGIDPPQGFPAAIRARLSTGPIWSTPVPGIGERRPWITVRLLRMTGLLLTWAGANVNAGTPGPDGPVRAAVATSAAVDTVAGETNHREGTRPYPLSDFLYGGVTGPIQYELATKAPRGQRELVAESLEELVVKVLDGFN